VLLSLLRISAVSCCCCWMRRPAVSRSHGLWRVQDHLQRIGCQSVSQSIKNDNLQKWPVVYKIKRAEDLASLYGLVAGRVCLLLPLTLDRQTESSDVRPWLILDSMTMFRRRLVSSRIAASWSR